MQHAYIIGFVVVAGIITYYDIFYCHDLPWPPRFIATGLVFVLISMLSLVSAELAGVLALGIVLAAVVNKGFTQSCSQKAKGTTQPASYNATTLANQATPPPSEPTTQPASAYTAELQGKTVVGRPS